MALERMNGLYSRVVRHGSIVDDVWRGILFEGQNVGTCRRIVPGPPRTDGHFSSAECGGDLVPEKPHIINSKRTDYVAACALCGQEIVAPNGIVLAKSRRAAERSTEV